MDYKILRCCNPILNLLIFWMTTGYGKCLGSMNLKDTAKTDNKITGEDFSTALAFITAYGQAFLFKRVYDLDSFCTKCVECIAIALASTCVQ